MRRIVGIVLVAAATLAAAGAARAEDTVPPRPAPPAPLPPPRRVVPSATPGGSGAVPDGPAPLPSPAPAPAPLSAPAPSPAAPPPVQWRAVSAEPCNPCDEPRRGPVEIRDMYLLAQPRLTLPATSPDTLGCGHNSFRVQFNWSNSFGWRQTEEGETPLEREMLVDGEARTVDVTWLHGVTDNLDVGLRLPVHWRGAGVLDSIINDFHQAGQGFFLDNKRAAFDDDRFRIEGLLKDGTPFNLDDDTGTGLGNLEGIVRWRFVDGGRDCTSWALVGRATAPTGSGPFDVGGVDAGAQVVAARRVGRAFDVFAGVGETYFSEKRYRGIGYEQWRTNVYGALEWRPASTWSLILETDYTTSLISDILRWEGTHWYANLGAKIDLGCGFTFELGFSENVVDQQETADFGVFFGLEYRR